MKKQDIERVEYVAIKVGERIRCAKVKRYCPSRREWELLLADTGNTVYRTARKIRAPWPMVPANGFGETGDLAPAYRVAWDYDENFVRRVPTITRMYRHGGNPPAGLEKGWPTS